MKNFILPVLALLFAVSYAGAEVIDSVMYNPARLGQYEKLKVSDKASFKGGVKANTLTLQSAGTVSISNAGDYQVQNADVKGSVNMPSTHFVAPTIKAQGGTARFVQTGETSTIDTINSVLPRLKANILKMNAVTVNGTPGTDYDNDSIKGLKLGGNDIPAPSVNCSGLNWFARVDRNSGQTYRVLGLGTCEGGAEQDCTDAQYKMTHKSECCVSASESDSICYKNCTESYYAWTSGPSLSSTLGSSWIVQACTGYNNGYNYCNTFDDQCFNPRRLANSRGYSKVSYAHNCTYPCNESVANSAGNDKYCFVFEGTPWCNVQYGEVQYTSTFNGIAAVDLCKRVDTTRRCKNGW